MNLNAFTKKTIMIPVIAVAAVAIGGGSAVALGVADNSNDRVTGATRDQVVAAATALVGAGATVTDIEADNDGLVAYEVDLITQAGAEVELELDRNLKPVSHSSDRFDDDVRGDGDDGEDRDRDGRDRDGRDRDGRDRDDRDRMVGSIVVDDSDKAIADADVSKIAAAATAVAPGTVTEIESTTPDRDDTGVEADEAYEVSVRGANGADYEVTLDASLRVLAHDAD